METSRSDSTVRVVNFGSLNIDHVYRVPWFVRPGETLTSLSCRKFPGGKGLNQSVALARAGIPVMHAGRIGNDGAFLRHILDESGADTSLLVTADEPTGHAIIQVAPSGENSIILFGGANRSIGSGDASAVRAVLNPGDFLLLQNEISSMPEIMRKASEAGARIVFNPAPMDEEVHSYPLELVYCFILNEIEAEALAGGAGKGADTAKGAAAAAGKGAADPLRIADTLSRRFPSARLCLTLGERGAVYAENGAVIQVPAFPVAAVDTTAAGDTFTGYFTAGLAEGLSTEENLRRACAAAAICVTRPGASPSIPTRGEVEEFLK